MNELRTGQGTIIRYGEPIRAYHDDRKWYDSTNLKLLDESTFEFYDRVIKKPVASSEDEATSCSTIPEGLMLGTHWHEDIREHGPDGFKRFADTVAIIPDRYCRADGTTSTSRASREWFDRQIADGTKYVSKKHFETLKLMDERFKMNMAAMKYEHVPQESLLREVGIRWKHMGVPLKVRPDLISRGRLLDYKTTRDTNPARSFQRAVWKYKYDLSAVMYEIGCEAAGLASGPMIFVVTSTVGDCQTQVMTLSDKQLASARDRFQGMVANLKQRLDDGDWVPAGYGECLTIGE